MLTKLSVDRHMKDIQRWQKLTQAFPQCPLRGSRIVYDL